MSGLKYLSALASRISWRFRPLMATDARMDLSQLLTWSGLVSCQREVIGDFRFPQLTARFSLDTASALTHSGL